MAIHQFCLHDDDESSSMTHQTAMTRKTFAQSVMIRLIKKTWETQQQVTPGMSIPVECADALTVIIIS
jgi:hypothetical protein